MKEKMNGKVVIAAIAVILTAVISVWRSVMEYQIAGVSMNFSILVVIAISIVLYAGVIVGLLIRNRIVLLITFVLIVVSYLIRVPEWVKTLSFLVRNGFIWEFLNSSANTFSMLAAYGILIFAVVGGMREVPKKNYLWIPVLVLTLIPFFLGVFNLLVFIGEGTLEFVSVKAIIITVLALFMNITNAAGLTFTALYAGNPQRIK